MPTHYDTLEVDPDASVAVIRRAYRRLALVLHPDKAPDRRRQFDRVHDAYTVLSDPEAKAAYDLDLERQRYRLESVHDSIRLDDADDDLVFWCRCGAAIQLTESELLDLAIVPCTSCSLVYQIE